MTYSNTLKGHCHCGNIQIEVHTNKETKEFIPRDCSCSLCRNHQSSWISDPEGELHLLYKNKEEINPYQFGHKTSQFIVCKKCGVLCVALCEVKGVLKSVINRNTMLDEKFSKSPIITNFDAENIEERLVRRYQNWTGKVVIS